MVTTETLFAIVGTGLTVGGMVLAGGRWVVGAVIREDTQALREAMVGLKQTAETLTGELREAKAQAQRGTDELHEAIEAVRAVLSNHQERIAVLETIANQGKRSARMRAGG